MPYPNVGVLLDIVGDGSYSTDIASYAMAYDFQQGMAQPFDFIPRDSTMTLTVDNRAGVFSPERGTALAGLTKGTAIKLQTTFSATTRTMYVGWVDEIIPAPDRWGVQTAQIKCVGWISKIMAAKCAIPIQESKRTDEVIRTIIEKMNIYPPAFGSGFIVGRARVGRTTRVGVVTSYLLAESGKSTLAYEGDWERETSGLQALRQVTAREGGFLYVNRDGKVVFWNRHHFPLDMVNAVDATLNDSMSGMRYTWGRDKIDRVVVPYRTRVVNAGPAVLGVVNDAREIKEGGTITVSFNYGDQTSGVKVSGKNVIAPVATTDFTANSAEDGSGTDYTSSVTAAIVKESASNCEVEFTNAAPLKVYLQSGMQIRGAKVTDYGRSEAKAQVTPLPASWKEETWQGVMENFDEASGLAALRLRQVKDACGQLETLTFDAHMSDAMMTNALARTIGDRIAVAETQTGVNKEYFIVGERHAWDAMTNRYQTTWVNRPADATKYWIVGHAGFSNVGSSTRLIPF